MPDISLDEGIDKSDSNIVNLVRCFFLFNNLKRNMRLPAFSTPRQLWVLNEWWSLWTPADKTVAVSSFLATVIVSDCGLWRYQSATKQACFFLVLLLWLGRGAEYCCQHFCVLLGRLLRVDLIQWVSNVRPSVCPQKLSSISTKFGM